MTAARPRHKSVPHPTFTGTLDPDELAHALARAARAATGADAAAVWLLEPDRLHVRLSAHDGLQRADEVMRVAADDWLAGTSGAVSADAAETPAAAREWMAAERAGSAFVAPIAIGGTVLGSVLVLRRRRRAAVRGALARLTALAAEAAPALRNAIAHTRTRERAQRAETLLAVIQSLAGTRDLETVRADLAHRVARALDAEVCVIDLSPAAGLALSAVQAQPGSLAIPIARAGARFGTLTLSAPARTVWDGHTVDLARAIAEQIALAAENARLDRDTRAQANELAALREVSTRLTSTLDLASLLDTIAEAAVSLIGAQRCAVFELEPHEQRLYFRAGRGQRGLAPYSVRLGQGAAGSAALRRTTIFSPDVQRYPLPMYDVEFDDNTGRSLGEVVRRLGYHGILAVPLISKERVLGALCIYWDDVHEYDEREVRLLTGLAGHAAVAIDHARLHGAAVRRTEELSALLRAVRTVMAGLDPKVILEHIVHEAAAIARTPHVRLLLVDAATRGLRVAAFTGKPVPADFSIPLNAGLSGRVASTGEPVFVADMPNDPDNVLAAHDREDGIQTHLGLPIKIRDAVLGVLTFNTTTPRRYTTEELAYLASFADQAAIALDNARHYEDAQRALADLKAVQQKLVQGETLRAIGELAGGAAHHLNNLLTIVVGRVQLLLRSVEDERITRPLQIVERAAKDGAEVVRRLQQFSRMRDVIQARRVDLNAVVTEAIEGTRARWQDGARTAGVTIDVEPRLGTIPAVAGDPAALGEAVTNLILNAVDAMPKGGRIVIETAEQGMAVTLAVSDTGAGMTDEIRLRAHEPFFTTKGVKATGLGLSVAYGIARRHGGELTIASEAGVGTTVMVRLPVVVPQPEPSRAPAVAGQDALRVLLVDDERDVREALAEMLATLGHTVLTAASGTEALACVESEPGLDLVLTDLVMPGMTGWDVAADVKARRPHVTVGLITGWGDATLVTPETQGAVDFLLDKPVSMAALDNAVARARRR